MNLIPYRHNRRNEMDNFFGGFPSMFSDDFMRRFFDGSFGSMMNTRGMNTDVRETESSFIVEAELPGVKREDISVDVDRDVLTISVTQQQEDNREEGNYVHRERRYGSIRRSFDLTGINAQNISAKFENGVLTLELPKSDQQPSARRIEIN